MSLKIETIGTAVPENAISQRETYVHAKEFSCENARQERVLESLYNRTTIKNRSSVFASLRELNSISGGLATNGGGPTTGARLKKYAQAAPELAVAACRNAFAQTDIKCGVVTHLITVSCTGFSSPGFDIDLVEKLGLPQTLSRTNIGYMGCHGAFNAMRVADAFVTANSSAIVLLCAVEICTLHFQYGWSADSVIANSLFADGAGAMVITAAPVDVNSFSSRSIIVADSKAAMTWTIGDHGFMMTLSPQVPTIIESDLKKFIDEFLGTISLSVEDICGWAVHPGGPKILDAVEAALKLDALALKQSRDVLVEHGNMSSPTVLFILQKLYEENIPRPYLMLGFGPGLTIEAAVIS